MTPSGHGKRVLILSSEFPPGPGGIGTHAFQLATYLHHFGWQVLVAARQQYTDRDQAARFNESQPFSVSPFPEPKLRPLRLLSRAMHVRNLLERYRPSVVVASGEHLIYVGAIFLQRAGVPWIAIEHGWTPRAWERHAKQSSFAACTAVVCVSEYSRAQLLRGGVCPRAAVVIHNGADPEKFAAKQTDCPAPGNLGLPTSAELLVTVGSVTDRKGQDLVIRALPQILYHRPRVHYVMIGSASARGEAFMELARRLGVAENVSMTGVLSDAATADIIGRAKLFVMTSRHVPEGFEGFGIAVIEAAFAGLPAVVTGDSGLREAVADGVTGRVVPPGDPTAIASAVVEFLGNDSGRRQMGQSARARALKEFTWEATAHKYSELLSRLL
jgi:phosphatidyl-myo-inositol dimannoside synthase